MAKNLFNKRNPRLIKDLRAYMAFYICRETITDVMSALQIHLFMQNKANFRKSQINVSPVNTMDYDKRAHGERGKNKPNSNPIQSQLKPIKANKMPKQTQFKPKQTQFQSQYNAHAPGMGRKTSQETVSYSQNGEYRYNYSYGLKKRRI